MQMRAHQGVCSPAGRSNWGGVRAPAPHAAAAPPAPAPVCSCSHAAATEPAAGSRRGLLLGLGSLAASLALQQQRPAQAAAGASSASDAGNRALVDYMELEGKGKLKDKKALDDFRGRFGIRRNVDGRVAIRAANGDWYSVRLDMEVPGAMLLRHEKSGKVFAIETEGLSQVDLSDDYILLMMFADGAWETEMAPIEFEDDKSGAASQLAMQEKEFREFVGLLKELEVQEVEAKK